jgi:hypothetical protein
MNGSNSGVARVSVVWIVVAGVIALCGLAFAFMAQSETAAEREKRIAGEQAATDAATVRDQEIAARRAVSGVLGFSEGSEDGKSSSLEQAQAAFVALRDTFKDIGDEDTSVQLILPKIQAAYSQELRKIQELEQQISTLEGELEAAKASAAQVASDKDGQIAQLRQEVGDEKKNASQREAELQDRLDSAVAQLNERDADLRQAKADAQQEIRRREQEILGLKTRTTELAKTTAFLKDPFANYPDGSVIQVSETLPLGWIDLGSRNRLSRGTRFRIESGTVGARRQKGWAEVTRVDDTRAEVAFSGLVDRFDPIVAGDVLINPIYDPSGERNAVLVGRFSGRFNKEALTHLLAGMGVTVQPKLDLTTHFLVVGSEILADPETGEPLEEPIQASDLPVYKDAEARAIHGRGSRGSPLDSSDPAVDNPSPR